MKKLLSILLILVFTLSITTTVFAEDKSPFHVTKSEDGKTIYTTVNEYELYKFFTKKTDKELLELGYTEDTIKSIKNMDIKKELEKRSKLDKEKLKYFGYTDNQIEMLQQFTGSEAQLYALASDFTMYVRLYGHYYDSYSNKSKMSVYYGWEWSSAPTICMKDIIGYAYR